MPPSRPASTIKARHGVATIGLSIALIIALTVPAFAHASFPGYSAFGFAPNTAGGTGAAGSTPPYAASSTNTIFARVPFEQTVPHNGSDDTTVQVDVVVPSGWTNPTCGAAKTQIKTEATANTNQPGDDVAGWTCSVIEANGRKVIHFTGPQVVAPATAADSPQFFSFSVRTPSPDVQTTYNGTAGTEGFIVDQAYASGETVHWIPDASFTGNPPAGSTSVVAGGLARTVAAWDPAASVFPDVPVGHSFLTEINWMAHEGITSGFADGTFGPTKVVSRQGFAQFLYNLAGTPDITMPAEPTFTDVGADHPFRTAIEWAASQSIVTGYPDDTFGPTAPVTRQSAAAFVYRFDGSPEFTPPVEASFTDVGAGHTFLTEIEWMAANEIAAGNLDGSFTPTGAVTRQTAAAFLHRYDQLPS